MENRSLSPTSSLASLDADLSDFSDSDEFDIVSSSDSARSREDDVVSIDNESEEDGNQALDIGPPLTLESEWFGVVGPTDVLDDALARHAPVHVEEPTVPPTNIISDSDAMVMDALSQSLERSTESVEAHTPINGSIPSLHFVTSPRTTRRSSSVLSRSQLDLNSSSHSVSTLQLAFPDPLSPVTHPVSPLGESLVEEPHPEQVEEANWEETTAHSSSTSAASSFVIPSTTLPTGAPDLVTETNIITQNLDELGTTEEPSLKSPLPVDQGSQAFLGGSHVGSISHFILNTAIGHRWTASVIISILALLLGGTTYLGSPASMQTPSRSITPPSSTTWNLLQPVNKSILPNPSSTPSPTSVNPFKEMSLSLFPAWSVSGSPREQEERAVRGIKRKRGSCSERHGGPAVTCTETVPPRYVENVESSGNIESTLPILLIDAPREGGSDGSSAHSLSLSLALPVDIPDAAVMRAAIVDYLSPTAESIAALSDDLMRALDELLDVIHAQTSLVSLESIRTAIERGRAEATYRHRRARRNARKIREKGETMLYGFKQTVVAHAATNARELAEGVREKAAAVADIARTRAVAVAEGARDGFRQRMMIKKSKPRSFLRKCASHEFLLGRRISEHQRRRKPCAGW
ncbi:hypothetical protein BS47DRAFT_1340152 [Hydnum rufescens UP504]|uniref:Uncharacterized protein n=1 Tax=Hydnum rufescens UP504 TaxID=1448309 RepID=A0A9P6B445_9AGAM|nr:hypothetical protein BS47DRAFT_1340152 [Hydnum rufescens UP504]